MRIPKLGEEALLDTAWTIALLGVVWIIAFVLTGDAAKATFWMSVYALVGLLTCSDIPIQDSESVPMFGRALHVFILMTGVGATAAAIPAVALECLDPGPTTLTERTYSDAELAAMTMTFCKSASMDVAATECPWIRHMDAFVATRQPGDVVRGFELAAIGHVHDTPHGIFLMRDDCVVAMPGFAMP